MFYLFSAHFLRLNSDGNMANITKQFLIYPPLSVQAVNIFPLKHLLLLSISFSIFLRSEMTLLLNYS